MVIGYGIGMTPLPTLSREEFDALDGESLFALFLSMREEMAKMAEEIQGLRDQLFKNSRNSGNPPSSDGYMKPRPKSLRPKGKRKSGGQRGHPGQTLKRVANPDHVVSHPAVACPHCETDLTGIPTNAVEKRQVFDVPPIRLEVTEHQAEVKCCPGCGEIAKGAFPAEVTGPTQYGTRLKVQAVYLNSYHLLPLGRIRALFADFYGQAPSESLILTAGEAVVEGIAPSLEAIREQLKASSVVHCDETGLRVEGGLNWLHSVGTEGLTYYAVHPKRGQQAMREIGILPQFRGRAVHDGWSSYFQFDQCAHALCNAHHLRELTFVEERYGQAWAVEMTGLLLAIKDEVAAAPPAWTSLPPERLAHHEQRYDALVRRGLAANPPPKAPRSKKRGRKRQSPPKNLLDRLGKYRSETLAFMRDFRVPFDNNLAERDVRMMKVKQKISGTFRMRSGVETFCAIHSYLSTARKQGYSVLDAIQDALQGQPFYPSGCSPD